MEPDRKGWARLDDMYHKYDEERIKDAKEDIDTLLVFVRTTVALYILLLTTASQAGLFSAVLSAFLVETYTDLSEDPNEMNTKILMQISSQLASLSQSNGFINSTVPAFSLDPPFSPQRSSVRINALWSCSLVISLITASLGILVKQWLHEFMAQATQNPQYRIRVRFFRSEGLARWQVFEIAATLPLLLQLALLLFFVGLSEFLRELNSVVGWVATGTILGWLGVFAFTTFAPILSSQCPYQTPILKGPLGYLRPAAQHTYGFIKQYIVGGLCVFAYPLMVSGIKNIRFFMVFNRENVKSWLSQARIFLPDWPQRIFFAPPIPLPFIFQAIFGPYRLLRHKIKFPRLDTSSWKYTPAAEESETQRSDGADPGIILYSDVVFLDQQLRGTLLECGESMHVLDVLNVLNEIRSAETQTSSMIPSWRPVFGSNTLGRAEGIVRDILLRNSIGNAKDLSWLDVLYFIVKEGGNGVWWNDLPTLINNLIQSNSEDGTRSTLLALYFSLDSDTFYASDNLSFLFVGSQIQVDSQCT